MDFSRGGDLIVPPISNYFRFFSFVSSQFSVVSSQFSFASSQFLVVSIRDLFDTVRASVGTLINKSGVKMTQNAREQMFLLGTYCSCLLLLLFYYSLTLHLRANTFSTVIHCFRKDHYLMLVIIISF